MRRHDRTQPYPVMSDKPGLMLHDPRRRLFRVLVLYALLPLICAAAGSYVAYALAADRIDQRVETLEADLAERRAARAQLDAQQQAAADRLRNDACVAFDRVRPRDAAVEQIRRRYGCPGVPAASPTPSPSPSTSPVPGKGPPPSGFSASSGGGDGRGAPGPQPPAAPPPANPPPAQPPPAPPAPPVPAPPDLLEVCVPLIVCLRLDIALT